MRWLLSVALLVGLGSSAEAQKNCAKGKPCGNTCIARDKVCRIGTSTPAATRQVGSGESRSATPAQPAPARPPALLACTVASVTDGDTVRCSDGRRVRLLLIDAPEMAQGEYGRLARAALLELLPAGSQAWLELDVQPEDRYGRTLAYVYLPDGRMVNEELLARGLAVVSVYQPNVGHVDRLRAAAAAAKHARRGLWSSSAFECLPADHRRGRC